MGFQTSQIEKKVSLKKVVFKFKFDLPDWKLEVCYVYVI